MLNLLRRWLARCLVRKITCQEPGCPYCAAGDVPILEVHSPPGFREQLYHLGKRRLFR